MSTNSEPLLSRLSEIVIASGPRLERLEKVASVLRGSTGNGWVGLYEVDFTRGEVRNLVWDGPAGPGYPTFPISKGLTNSAIAEKRTVNVGDVKSDARYLTALGSTRSEIIVPVLDGDGDVVGTIDVESARVNAFDAASQQRLEEVARRFASFWLARG